MTPEQIQIEQGYEPLGREKVKKFLDVAVEDMKELDRHRKQRNNMLRNMTGMRYTHGNEAGERLGEVPLNLLGVFMSTYSQQLSAGMPRASVRTEYPDMDPIADDLRVRLDFEAEKLDLDQVVKECVNDALIGLGIVKVALTDAGQVEVDGEQIDATEVFTGRVHYDDFLIDTAARSMREVRYMGDRYRMPLGEFRERYHDRLVVAYGETVANEIVAAVGGGTDNAVDDRGAERANADHVSSKNGDRDRDIEKMAEVWEVYFVQERQIATLALNKPSLPPINIRPYTGPEPGPYILLPLGQVPDHVIPLAPALAVSPLHELANNLYCKLMEDARDHNSVNTFRKGADDDAQELRKAGRNDWIGVNDPDAIQRKEVGGVNREMFGFVLDIQDKFNFFSGNVESLAGLGAQTGTVGQEEIIRASASARVAQMQQEVDRFVGQIFTALAYYIWTNPLERTMLSKQVTLPSGGSLRIPFEYMPTGELEDLQRFTIKIVPYSMQSKTPAQVVQELMGLISQFYLPIAPLMAQQGGQIDFSALNNLISDNSQLHELKDVVKFQDQPPSKPDLPPPGEVSKPATTTRTHIRQDRGGGSGRRDMIKQLMAAPAGAE